jgi:tRNA(fMet)-specific endonuclease VapC
VNPSYLLDTSVVSSPISRNPHPQIVKRLEQFGHLCATGAPVWHELVYGSQRLATGKRREALERYLYDVVLASFPILAYDEDAARWHGQERARLERIGRPTPFVDGQIAAIAFVHKLTLVTVNTKDFRRFRGVKVENWTERKF